MKVFSKQHKHNKSTPALTNHQPTTTHHQTITVQPHPKGINKIKTFKQILTENIHQLTCAKASKQQQKDKQLKSKFNKAKLMTVGVSQSSVEGGNRNNLVLSSIKMIKSVINIDNPIKTTRQYTKSSDKISSIIYYPIKSKQLFQNQNTLNLNLKAIQSQKIKKSIELNRSIYSNTSAMQNKQNISGSYAQKDNSQKENTFSQNYHQIQFKKINHYKNTRVNYNHRAVVRKWGLKDFKVGRKLGKGRFGQVNIVEQKQSGCIFALKRINMTLVREQEMQSQIVEQIKLQLYLNSPNILKMYGFFKEGDDLYMILQYAEQKCLFNKMIDKFDEKQCHYYILQMVKALRYCHSEFVLHRDLKPQNILISFGVAKLADFGWAAYAPKFKRITFCGTLDYVSPQILKGALYDERVDIWSLGVLIYQLSIGRAPFQSNANNQVEAERATMNRILKCDFKIPSTISSELKQLIQSILNSEPSERPTLQQIECSSWMSRFKEQAQEINKGIWQWWSSVCEK